jgi:GNAT superfamily N-acetyltransferase
VAGANTPNLRQVVMYQMEVEFGGKWNKKSVPADSDIALAKRQKQYGRLAANLRVLEDINEVSSLITELQPLQKTTTSSTWRDYDDDDRVVTRRLGKWFDLDVLRGFVCLCTRCREVRNQNKTPDSVPVLTWRTYRSSNGIEIFLSFEDHLGYLYGFTRLLLPDVWTTMDYPWLWEGTAIIRELHVYGQLQSVWWVWKWSTAQHKGLWTQLLEAAEQIAWLQEYKRISVISGIGVRKYYEKKGYHLEGTYMVKWV